jgi:iron complex transport system substrate-binding protein
MLEQAAQLGRLLGREADVTAAGQALLERIEQDCGSLQERRSTLAVFGSDVNIGVDVARTPMIDALSRCADYPFTFDGESHEFPSFSLEQLLDLDPDVLFVETIGFGDTPPEALTSQLAEHPIWRELSAIKNGDVREVSFEVWGTTRGIHGTGLVLDEALPVLYPEQFPAAQP